MVAQWTEYLNCFKAEIRRQRLVNVQEVETDEGLSFCFGQPPSKQGSSIWKLISVIFWKQAGWITKEAYTWWQDHQVYILGKRYLGKKIPEVDFWLDDTANSGAYIFLCRRGAPKAHPAGYWLRS